MTAAPIPANEAQRLAALRALRILDTPAEERFDRIARVAARLFDVPIALVSLVDANRQWFKSCLGLDASETPRSLSFCAHAILDDDTLVIPDAQLDPRFADNPFVTGEPYVRFYAGQPLMAADGSKVGTLCIIDRRPRQMNTADRQALRDLATWAASELTNVQLSQALTIQRESETRIRAVMDGVVDAIVTFDRHGVIESSNVAAERLFGYKMAEIAGRDLDLLVPTGSQSEAVRRLLGRRGVTDDETTPGAQLLRLCNFSNLASSEDGNTSACYELVGRSRDGATFPLEMSVSELRLGEQRQFIASMRDITERKQAEQRLTTQYAIARVLAEANTLGDAAPNVLEAMCETLGWQLGIVWLVEPHADVLRCAEVWHIPTVKSDEFEALSRQTTFARGDGLPGRVWASGQPVWINDVVKDPNFPRAAVAAKAGLHTALAMPIQLGNEIFGVMELFSHDIRQADQSLIEVIVAIGSQIGQFIKRERAVHAIGQQAAKLREQAQLLDLAHDTIMVRSMDGTITFWNKGAEEMYGWTQADALGKNSHSLLQTEFPTPPREVEASLLREGRWEGELARHTRSGTRIIVASRWALQRDEHGKPAAVLEINNDITERKRAEQALMESEGRTRELYAAARRQAQELALLDQVRTVLARELDLPVVFQTIVDAIAEIYGYALVSLYLRKGDDLELERQVGYSQPIKRLPITSGVIGQVARTGQPALITDVQAEPAFVAAFEGLVSEVCVPLRDQGRIVGVLNVESMDGVRLGEADLRLMTTLSEHINIAIERARLYTEARTSEERLRTVITNLPVILFVMDRDGAIILSEGNGLEALGRASGESVGKSVFDLYRDVPDVLDSTRRALAGEMVTTTMDLAGVILEVRFTPLRDEAGVITGVIGVAINITERRRAEEQLRASELKFRSVTQSASDGIIAADSDGNIISWNTGAQCIFGYEEADVLGKPLTLLMPERYRELHRRGMERVRSGGETRVIGHTVELHGLRKDGSEFPVELSLATWQAGDAAFYSGILRDITERKQAETQLRGTLAELERQYHEADRARSESRAVLDAAGDAMVFVAPNQSLSSVNRRFVELFGVEADAVVGHRIDELQPLVERLFVDSTGFATFVGGRASDLEDQFTTVVAQRSPEPRELELFSTPVRSAGGAHLGRLYVFRDVTREREVDRMKSEFVSVVSHELRTPLTAIRGSLGLLAGGLFGALAPQGQQMLDIAVANTDRLVRLINDILDIERLESGKAPLARVLCNAADLMAQVGQTMQPVAEKAGVALSVAPCPAHIWADPDRIIQALTNLLGNAIKFSPPGGAVWLAAECQGEELVFSVKDQGRGIPADKRSRIFERFGQVDSSDAREKGGTGLGLAITQSIVEQHGGRIWVESTPGQGSVFCFTLPVSQEHHEEISAPAGVVDGATVLVCDDDPSIRQVVRTLLEQQGYRTIVTATGKEALQQAAAQQPAAILLDLMMPGMDGWETMAALKASPETAGVPVIIFSVLSRAEGESQTTDAADWVGKPVDEAALFRALQHAIDSGNRGASLLLLEDDRDLAQAISALCQGHGIKTVWAQTGREAIQLIQRELPNVLVLNLMTLEGDGFAVVDWLRQHDRFRQAPLVVYTAHDLAMADRERLQRGQTELLVKDRLTPEEFERRLIGLLDRIVAKGRKEGDRARELTQAHSADR